MKRWLRMSKDNDLLVSRSLGFLQVLQQLIREGLLFKSTSFHLTMLVALMSDHLGKFVRKCFVVISEVVQCHFG